MARNRLSSETSPYLLQHAKNPVHWQPWGPEALARAKAEDKPILLSVGYSACHWCHVMERESFRDAEIAAQMNRDFVCIKVDREERPDLDDIYMKSVQALTGGGGGWPLTVALTPDARPFFGGTYFPPTRQGKVPGFADVLTHCARTWADSRDDVTQVTERIVHALQRAAMTPVPADDIGDDWCAKIRAGLEPDFDDQHGGVRGTPKFPPHAAMRALMLGWHLTRDDRALQMARTTLDAMARGGLYDLLGGGFARYSVDEEWRVPHFEKMLYDNAQLLDQYVECWQITGADRYAEVVRDTVGWVLREMRAPDGGFAASQDADSEGEEGRYYGWTPAQLRAIFGEDTGTQVAELLQVRELGSFSSGMSVLRLARPWAQLTEQERDLLGTATARLRALRGRRLPPARDDKVITSWNGMMIGALAKAGAAMGEPAWIAAAADAADFILGSLRPDDRLLRTYRDGRAHQPAYADDHAALGLAMVELWEATSEHRWLREGLALADATIDLFWDASAGGVYFTGRDVPVTITRVKPLPGGAEPGAQGLSALLFARLSTISDRPDLGEKADQLLRQHRPLLDRAPHLLGVEARAVAWRGPRAQELAIIGPPDHPERAAMLAAARRPYRPLLTVVATTDASRPDLEALLPWLRGKAGRPGLSTAWLCTGRTCRLPTRSADGLADWLAEPPPATRPPARMTAPPLPTDPHRWVGGDPVSLSARAGTITILDFWTSGCVNCLHLLPELAAVEARFSAQDVRIIGVHSAKFPMEQQPEAVARAHGRLGLDHPVLLDPDHTTWSEYAVRGWPTVIVVDGQGKIAWRRSGEIDRHSLGAVVARLLGEPGEQPPPALPSPQEGPSLSDLRHPGRIACFPDTGAQELGQDPFSDEARVYIADTGNHSVVEAAVGIDTDGWPTLTALRRFGSGTPGRMDGPGDRARFDAPQGIARSGHTLWVADTGNHSVRAVDLRRGVVRTVAGTGALGHGTTKPDAAPSDNIPTDTALRSPWGITVASAENGASPPDQPVLFIAMAGSHQIWLCIPHQDRLSPVVGTGAEAHVDGPATRAVLAQPSGVELFGRYLVFVDAETSSVRYFDVGEHQVGTLVGRGLFDFGDVDGPRESALMQHPLDIAVADQHVWVADTYNHKIRAVGMGDGTVRTVASADLCEPSGLCRLGPFLLVADTGNHRLVAVRRSDGALRPIPLAINGG